MKIIIKSQPEDFIVEEIANLPFKKKGDFGVYLLEKKHWNTVGALLDISEKTGVHFKNFSYGGKKDRHALSRQYIAIKGPKLEEIRGAGYSLSFHGFMDRPMGPDLIEANKFTISVRKLVEEDIKSAIAQSELVKKFGFTNYFDDQRFGSFDREQGFLAEKLLLGHLNGALKICLMAVNKNDRKEEKKKKLNFSESWGNWRKCRLIAKTEFEKKAFDYLIKKPNGFLLLLKQLPREKLSIYFSAYQSFIWNEIAREVSKERITAPFKVYPGVAGDYYFFGQLNNEEYCYLKDLEIPTLASNVKMSDGLCAEIFTKVMEERGIKNSLFNRLKVRQVFFRPTERKLIVKPQNFSFQVLDDEFNAFKKKLSLQFVLPRGSYATMLLKRLFSS